MAATLSAPVDVLAHLRWCRSIARGIANDYGFLHGSPEQQDLEACAALLLVEKAGHFKADRVNSGGDLGGAFRGWLHPTLKSECRREAQRLRNGGTYNTKRGGPLAVGGILSLRRNDGGYEAPGAHLFSDGRRPEPLEPLDELIRREDARAPLPGWSRAMLLAIAMELRLDVPVPAYGRDLIPPDVAHFLNERRFWVRTFFDHGFRKSDIARLLGLGPHVVPEHLKSTKPLFKPSKRWLSANGPKKATKRRRKKKAAPAIRTTVLEQC